MTLNNGKDVTLTLNFAYLYKLSKEKPEAYERYFKADNHIISKGMPENEDFMFEFLDIIYAAYLCGKIKEGTLDEAMEYEDFLLEVPEDATFVINTATNLISPKSKRDSEKPSTQHGKAKTA